LVGRLATAEFGSQRDGEVDDADGLFAIKPTLIRRAAPRDECDDVQPPWRPSMLDWRPTTTREREEQRSRHRHRS
jgi:hypothetical protein